MRLGAHFFHGRFSRRSRLLTTSLSSSDRAILETWEDLVSRACCRFSVFFRLTSPGGLRTLKTRFLTRGRIIRTESLSSPFCCLPRRVAVRIAVQPAAIIEKRRAPSPAPLPERPALVPR